MSDISNYKISIGDQLFFINSSPIAGVQSLQFDSNRNISSLKYLGQTKSKFYANGIQGGSVSIDSLVISDDVFLPLTGISGFNGYIIKDRSDTSKNYSFASGYMSSYSVKGGIDSPTQITVGIDVFGNFGTLESTDHSQISTDFSNISNHSYTEPTYKFSHPKYTTVSCNNINSNRLQNFEINILIPRQPTYYLGKINPDHVEINGPISVNCSLQYEIDNYDLTKSKNKSVIHQTNDISIALKTSSGTTIQTYTFNDMELLNESLNSSNNSYTTVDAEYQTFIN